MYITKSDNLMILYSRLVLFKFIRWSCDIDIHMFLYGLLGTTLYTLGLARTNIYYQYAQNDSVL